MEISKVMMRTASMPNINGTITFKATISIARKPKYFLGIKIHRAIVQISWTLTTEYSDTQVVAVINLDPSKTDQQKADEVNAKLSEIAREYPSCDPTVEYAKKMVSILTILQIIIIFATWVGNIPHRQGATRHRI